MKAGELLILQNEDVEGVSADEPATEPLLDLRFAHHVHYSELTNSRPPNNPMCAVDRYLMDNQLTGDHRRSVHRSQGVPGTPSVLKASYGTVHL